MKLKQLEDLDNPQLEQKINRFADMAINNKIAFYQMKIQHDAAVLQNVLSRIGGTSNHRDYAQVQKDGSMFLHEELTRIDTVAIEATPAQFTTRQIWKVRNVGAGFRALKQPFYERQGKAVFMGDAQTDATKETGRVSAEKTSDLKQVRKCFDWYEIDLFDIESMMVAGEQLDTQKGIALREGIEALLNDTVFFGYKQAGIYGFFDHAVTAKDVYKEIAPTAGASTYYDWARKTASEIYDDIDKLATACFDATNGQIDTKILVVPPKQYKRLYSARFGDVIGDTVAKRLLDNNIVTKILFAPELKGVVKSGIANLATAQDVAIITTDSEMNNRIEHPLEFTIMPILDMQTHIKVAAHANTSGLHVYKKYSSAFLTKV